MGARLGMPEPAMTSRPYAADARRLCPESDEHHDHVWFCQTCRLIEMRLTPITDLVGDLLADTDLRITNPFNTTGTTTSMPETDIIDRIDELVDEQMAAGEDASDYLTGDHNYPRCPHCGRHWHGLPITDRIASMYQLGRMDPEYTAAEDNSRVVCEGSDFIGPQRPHPGVPLTDQSRWSHAGHIHTWPTFRVIVGGRAPRWMHHLLSHWQRLITDTAPSIALWDDQFQLLGRVETRTTPFPDLGELPDVDVKFGPENWIHEIRRLPLSLQFPHPWPAYRLVTPLQAAVHQHWADFTAPNYPIPEAPGYDFSAYADEQPPTTGPARQPHRR